jgi:anthranilate/para-aminobenzoate synthase component I
VRAGELERLETFALLGPGFGEGRWLLLRGLREGGDRPLLFHAGFEAAGGEVRRFAADGCESVEVTLEAPLQAPAVTLNAEAYREAVDCIREAIAAGDVYQVCHTVRADVGACSGAELLALMCAGGIPRFAAWVRLPGGAEFVSASPELFFETDGPRVRTEPMKGTARPGAEAVLEASEKDRAELAMITDLLRNDLTPVCRPGSVRVEAPRRFIRLAYAVQCVSDVAGDLLPGATPLDVLAALHPGGSVTGAPKEAAVRMIRRLERGPRGAYCGALGLWRGERSVCSLLIRTAARAPSGWTYGVGSGIVWDSDAAAELAELRVKLGALGCGIPSS